MWGFYFDYKNKLKVTFNNKIDTDLLLNIGRKYIIKRYEGRCLFWETKGMKQ